MSGSFSDGAEDGARSIVASLLIGVVLSAFAGSGLIPASYSFMIGLVNIVGTIILVLSMPRWGLMYLIGWIFMAAIFIYAGVLPLLDSLIYLGAPVAVLGWTIYVWFRGRNQGF